MFLSIVSESSYILIAEYSIFLLVSWASVLLKSKTGTFALLYSSHVVSCTVCYVVLILVVFMSRLAEIKSKQNSGHFTRSLLEAVLYFNIMISIAFTVFIVTAWNAVESDVAQNSNLFFLLLQSNIYTKENEYLMKVGGILAICLVAILSILFFFSVTSFCRSSMKEMKEEHGPDFLTCTGEFITGFSVLSLFTQISLCKFLERACGLTDGSKCTLQYIAQDSILTDDYFFRYQISFVYIAVYFSEFYIETFFSILALPFNLCGFRVLTSMQSYILKLELILYHFSNIALLSLHWLFSIKLLACYNSCFFTLNLVISLVFSIHTLLNLIDTIRSVYKKKPNDQVAIVTNDTTKEEHSAMHSLYLKKSFMGTKQTNKKIYSIKLKKF